MKIIDVINDGANLLGLDDVCVKITEMYDNEEALLQDVEIGKLFNLTKFAIRELCTHYVPVVVAETITTRNAQYPISDLTNYIKIIKVTKDGEVVPHKIIKRIIILPEDGTYNIEYTAYPQIESIFESIDYLADISSEVVVFGLCSYYSLVKGMFDEFERFHEEYVIKAENMRELKVFDLPRRRWE